LNYHPDHNLYSLIRMTGQADFYRLVLDTSFNVIDSIASGTAYSLDMHDFQILDNGNLMVVNKVDSAIDLSAFNFYGGIQGSDSTICAGFVLREFDAAHNVVFEWNSLDHIHPTEAIDSTYGYIPLSFDCAHGNSVDEDTDGNFLVSLRHTNSVVKVNRASGNVMWRLGGRLSDFTFPNDSNGFSGQHDVRRTTDGNIAMFDNMNSKTPAPIRSRAVEFELDMINMTATRVWKYRYLPGFFARAMGSHQETPFDYHLIAYGYSYRPNPSVVLIDPADNIVSTLYFRDSATTYRARIHDLPFELNRPIVQCSNSSGTLTLTAPSNHSEYLWSSGETTQSITVSATGTYQVWVNHGIGMMGSEPTIITDLLANCLDIAVDENGLLTAQRIVAVYDLLGRSVHNPELNALYLVRYEDETSEIISWSEAMQQRLGKR
jgi:hypothetical protein